MSIATLDEICEDNGYIFTREGSTFSTDSSAGVQFAAPRGAYPPSRWTLNFTGLTRLELADLIELFEGVGYSRVHPWTPPRETVAVGVRFERFVPRVLTGAVAEVECALVFVPGYAAPGTAQPVGEVTLLGTAAGLDLTAEGSEVVYTATEDIIITAAILHVTEADTVTDPPTISLGLSPAEDDMVAEAVMPGLLAAGDQWSVPIVGRSKLVAAGHQIRFAVASGAAAASLISTLDLIGYRSQTSE